MDWNQCHQVAGNCRNPTDSIPRKDSNCKEGVYVKPRQFPRNFPTCPSSQEPHALITSNMFLRSSRIHSSSFSHFLSLTVVFMYFMQLRIPSYILQKLLTERSFHNNCYIVAYPNSQFHETSYLCCRTSCKTRNCKRTLRLVLGWVQPAVSWKFCQYNGKEKNGAAAK